MNKAQLIGRLTRDPEIRYSSGDAATCISRFSLAVDRNRKNAKGEKEADFIPCTAFGKTAELMEKYCKKGMKIAVCGRIQTGSYTNKNGERVYTTDVIVDELEFVESKSAAQSGGSGNTQQRQSDEGFMDIPDGIEGDALPFA